MFYVYTLADPRDAAVFYVGKGKARRAWQHEADVRKGKVGSNPRKCAVITEIIEDGLSPVVSIIAEYESEREAFDHEAELISRTPNLTNILAKGGGWALSPAELSRRAAERTKAKVEITRAHLAKWLKAADSWGPVTFPGMRDGDRLAEEFRSIVRGLVAA